MKVLAVEISSDAGSLALVEDGGVVASVPMDARQRRSQGLFDAGGALLSGAGWGWEALGAFAVGRGPGSYTGLRVSLTAACGWALPQNKSVWTVSSGAALAAEILAEKTEMMSVVVWGDARRGQIWAGRFEREPLHLLRQTGAWRLLPAELRGREWPDAHWIEPGRVPQAEWVGRLFFAGGPSEERQPIYLHPPVIVPPRFDAEGRPRILGS
ncbi:MAG TPA: tRNA (adenosine(37)-N6)-threonylcarbamoyltransferase complex dimerization subunit type 1 TsaB [Kiritimatiellia bacterium]|jgi:tRNA threonylcarbamoyl adenosine modification protein YeaZ|nr:tRNA (adenosine(37)-N6)-threonylcarbamoyltransferase complex dimerization subunit type 1 TsaB [Lentisphaerota bacterium]HPC19402.1 tRNA (adenosine(37)-N6)-threonylcarbamoyltransferase complex dimerization subunit type 1 TsaB [Kiritimatiellia bacterium]HQQ60686.1 tRNA (adenosine(37)-N6)-threonylcarbamoyltransferase complex dimerization subunit type 1 TsaB [Kiritimatiellia bacterium]